MPSKESEHWNRTWQRGFGKVNSFARRALVFLRGSTKRILDLGCGTGKDALFFAEAGHEVVAFDFSPNALDWIQREGRRRSLANLQTVEGDIGKRLPFPDHSFDAVYAHLSLHYFTAKKTPEVFEEVRRILAKGGVLFVKCKSVDDALYGKGRKIEEDVYEHEHVRHFFRKEYLRDILRNFDIVRLRRSSSVYHRYKSAFVEAIATKR